MKNNNFKAFSKSFLTQRRKGAKTRRKINAFYLCFFRNLCVLAPSRLCVKILSLAEKVPNLKFAVLILSLLVSIQMFLPTSAVAQRRDYLNELEIELVRDAQMIDLRTEVFVEAIDRRFLVINNQTVRKDKKPRKDAEKWGELPVGTRSELLLDIEKILAAAIDNIDDVAVRDQKSELFPKAVRILADGANRFLPQLKSQLDKTNDQREKGAIIGAIDFCNQIIEASAKVPADAKKKKS